MMSSLVRTATSKDGGSYTELEDGRYGSQVASAEKAKSGAEPENGTIMINSEISVRSHETLS
jgi:hypothetical protein